MSFNLAPRTALPATLGPDPGVLGGEPGGFLAGRHVATEFAAPPHLHRHHSVQQRERDEEGC